MEMYGSLFNRLEERMKNQPTPVVGMGCTVMMYTDRVPCQVTRVASNGKRFWMRRLAYKIESHERGEGTVGTELEGPEIEVRRMRDGTWKELRGDRVLVGRAEAYRDPEF